MKGRVGIVGSRVRGEGVAHRRNRSGKPSQFGTIVLLGWFAVTGSSGSDARSETGFAVAPVTLDAGGERVSGGGVTIVGSLGGAGGVGVPSSGQVVATIFSGFIGQLGGSVGGGNHPPIPVDDELIRHPTQAVKVRIADLLSNDQDPDPGDELRLDAVLSPASGIATVQIIGDRVFYSPNGYLEFDTFEYQVTDLSGARARATVRVIVRIDSGATLNIKSIFEAEPGVFRIVFAGIPGLGYTIQHSASISPSVWRMMGVVKADAVGEFSFEHVPDPSAPTGFYRAVHLGNEDQAP